MFPVRSLPLAAVAALALAAPTQTQAQDLSGCFVRGGDAAAAAQRPSPMRALTFTVGGQEAKLCYGSPKVNGRTIMGELVPFGAAWRMGANEATALHIPFAGDIGGVKVEPGVYSLIAVPSESGEWEIFVNSQAERWGMPINDAVRAGDLGSFKRQAGATSTLIENLTFTWMSHGDAMGHLVMEWENTRVDIPIHKGEGHH